MNKGQPYILWLPSWYPNPTDSFIGDFIQRHAVATAAFVPIVVVHLVQTGAEKKVAQQVSIRQVDKNLKEHILIAPFRPTGIALLDKLLYHLRYQRFFRNYLRGFFEINGLPAGVHVHVPMKAGNLARWIKKEYHIPYLLSEHSSAYVPEVPDHFFNRSFLYRWQVRRIMKYAVGITNVSDHIGKVLKGIFSLPQVAVIRNVVDTHLFYPSNTPPSGTYTFLHVSSLDANKNIDVILEVFGRLALLRTGWQLVLVGPPSKSLLQQIRHCGLQEKVRLTGMISYAAVANEMRNAHCLVLFSKMENFPCVVIEALCSGLPVVAGAVSGVPEAVGAHNGILVQPGDKDALLAALIKVWEDDSLFDRAQIAADAALQYSYERVGQQIFNLYQSCFVLGG